MSSPVYQIDRVVVAEHAEVVGRRAIAGVDVVDVGVDPVGREGVEVVVEVVRAGRLGRRGARVVLGRHHQHLVAGLRDGLVGERGRSPATALEPDLDRVTGVGAGDHAAQLPVVDVGRVVALAAVPLARRRALRRPLVDAVLERHLAEAALGQHLDRLRVAVGVVEREVRVPGIPSL